MATLYEIDKALRDFEFQIDEETGEIINAEELDRLELARDTKIEHIGLFIKNLLSDAEAYKKEKDSFAQKEKAAKTKAENLKDYLDRTLDGETFKSTRVNMTYRRSVSVEIIDPDAIPERFLKFSVAVDKDGAKRALKAGETVPGAELVEKRNLQIK